MIYRRVNYTPLPFPQRYLNYTALPSYVKIYTPLPSYLKHIRKYFNPLP